MLWRLLKWFILAQTGKLVHTGYFDYTVVVVTEFIYIKNILGEKEVIVFKLVRNLFTGI